MESEQRGRASRASSTSSLGREVRCGCQYYQSDSLLPERRALLVRPSSRTMQQPPAVRCSEHEYEPIAPPLPHPAMAPIVRITDTDVMPVADSDDSIDDRDRLPAEKILDGDVILPLDGKIEDSAMEGRELGETGDTSEEQEPTAQQFQDRLEERFLASTPHTESRTDGEINTSQVDSSAMEELPLRRSARNLPERLKTQAGKLRSRLRGFQRPTFSFPRKRQKPEKAATKTTTATATSSGKSRKSVEKRPSRIDRIRTSISEKTGKFSLPGRSKFHLPERPKFNFPDRSKFAIKKPNIRLPGALKRPLFLREQRNQHSTESTVGSRRNIFDFATYPRIFDKKSKKRGEYATSSPKDSRDQSAESATFPRARKPRWAQRFGDSAYVQDQDRPEEAGGSDGTPPWHRNSMEEPPRLSAKTEEEIMAAAQAIPWDDARKRERYDEEEIQYMDYEQESSEMSDRHPAPPRRSHKPRKREDAMEVYQRKSDDNEEMEDVRRGEIEENEEATMRDDWRADEETMHRDKKFRSIPRSRSLDEDIPRVLEQERYEAFMAIDPRQFELRKMTSDEEEGEEEEEHEPSSFQSDREQQPSSTSSGDRRRRGVIEEIDSDEFFVRASGISQDDVNLNHYTVDEIGSEVIDALDERHLSIPPQRPVRRRTMRKLKEDLETNEEAAAAAAATAAAAVAAPPSPSPPSPPSPPVRPKRERSAVARHSREASIGDERFRERTRSDSRSDSRHRVVYRTDGEPPEPPREPLDDIVVVKPIRRKSRSSLRSQSQPPMETSILSPSTADFLPTAPPIVPVRRKRSHRETAMDRKNGDVNAGPICNGHREWNAEIASRKPVIPTRASRSRQSLNERLAANGDVITSASREGIDNLDAQFQQQEPVVPIAPKRRSRSRTVSVAADEDRTSHGAESLPEAGYIEEDIPREDDIGSMRDLTGYAIVEKREKPPRLPPPRRKRKFATTPRPTAPKRPQRAYSTLGPSRIKNTSVKSETIVGTTPRPADSAPYIEIDVDDVEHRDFRNGELLSKIQGRPLPAPPRPPRARRDTSGRSRTPFEYEEPAEVTATTQTDPLPDDMVIEEEITQAKLIMTPSRSGSQIMVSMERIPSPSGTATPPVPPLPMPQFLRKKEKDEREEVEMEEEEEREEVEMEMGTDEEKEYERLPREEDIRITYDSISLMSPSPTRDVDLNSKHKSAPQLEERVTEEPQSRPQIKPSLLPDEPLRINSLEVGDLKVDRLSVSQIEAHKIVASEVDTMMITASELKGGDSMEDSFSPAIIRELMAIRSHLETVMTAQAQQRHRENEKESSTHETIDIPTTDDSQVEKKSTSQDVPAEATESSETAVNESASVPMEDEKTDVGEDQKVIKTNVINFRNTEISHLSSNAQTKEFFSPQTFTVDELESKDKDEHTMHLLTVVQDKSLRILDSEHPLTLSSQTSSSHVDESRASYPPASDVLSSTSEPSDSPECVGESPNISVQTTAATTITTTTTTTITTTSTATTTATVTSTTELDATSLRDSKDDVSDSKKQTLRKSRSRSLSPGKGIVRQTASPVRSLPPAISVTPDTPDSTVPGHSSISTDAKPQRAVISYSSDVSAFRDSQPQRAVISHSSNEGQSFAEKQRESSQSPVSSLPLNSTHFIAFPVSEIPAQFFSLSETPTNQGSNAEPGIVDTTQQLLRALRLVGIKAMRYFIRHLTSTLNMDDTREKIRDVELTICALLLLVAGLLIYYFSSTRIITHHHHWDYFNPPQ